MGFILYDYRSLFNDREKELNFYNKCCSKYGNFEEEFLEANADSYTLKDWHIISYFAQLSEKFVKSFHEQLDPSILSINKFISPYVKESCTQEIEKSKIKLTLVFNRKSKLEIFPVLSSWK